jgi:hypothetical protein
MADQQKPEIIDIGGWRWEVDEETQALHFLGDEWSSFAEAVAELREVNGLKALAIVARPKIVADAAEAKRSTKILPDSPLK